MPDRPNLLFWPAFLLLQWLLFWPGYLMGDESATLFPPIHVSTDQLSKSVQKAFVWRTNPDFFRFNAELTIVVAGWSLLSFVRRRWIRNAVTILYVAILIYYVYESVFLGIYQATPILYNNVYMIKDGLQFLLENLNISMATYLFACAGVILLVMSIIVLMRAALPMAQINRTTRIMLTLLAVLIGFSTYQTKSASADPSMVTSAVTFKVSRNINDSIALRQKVMGFDTSAIWDTYDLSSFRLENPPNIYLIFIESYGSVLYMREHFKPPYMDLLDRIDREFAESNWYVASALSESPTWGGGSWMAYTSAMFGITIDSQPQYLALFDRFQFESFHYPDLGSYLRSQGYEYAWLSSLSTELSQSRWRQYQNFYNMDRWIKHSDLNFVGPQYGWGPAPPDQYALEFAREQLAQPDRPFLLFFITQNSHYPWAPLPAVVSDWRTLNQPGPEPDDVPPEVFSPDIARRDYMESVKYELSFLSEFIRKNGSENDLFVIVGDHQPPRVSRRADTFSTPIHIVSRNHDLVRSLHNKGFVPGMILQDLDADLGHAGIYTLISTMLFNEYGRPALDSRDRSAEVRSMPYLPYGLALDLPVIEQ